MKRVYLLTGKPNLIKQVIAGRQGKAGGFCTEEIRSQGMRLAFRLVTRDSNNMIPYYKHPVSHLINRVLTTDCTNSLKTTTR